MWRKIKPDMFLFPKSGDGFMNFLENQQAED